MYRYTPQRDRPDAPFMQITLKNPAIPNNRVNCPALLDTGADNTFVPKNLLLSSLVVQARGRSREFQGFGGLQESLPYVISIMMDERAINSIEVWSWNGRFVLVGRDVLNQFCIEFNGLDQFFLVR